MLVSASFGSGEHSNPPQGFKAGSPLDGVKEEELQGSVGSAGRIFVDTENKRGRYYNGRHCLVQAKKDAIA